MEPLGHGAIRFLHRGDLREHVAFPVRLVLLPARAAARVRLQLLGALLHRGSFLVRESVGLLVDRGGAPGGLLRVLRWAHRNLPISLREEQQNPSSSSHTTPFLVWDFSTCSASSSRRFGAFH